MNLTGILTRKWWDFIQNSPELATPTPTSFIAAVDGSTTYKIPANVIVNAVSVLATGSLLSRTLADRFRDVVNLKDYALGNGSDQTAAIEDWRLQLATSYIDGLTIPSGVRRGHVSGGTYISTPVVMLSAGSGWSIFGDGPVSQLQDITLSLDDLYCSVRNLRLIGTGGGIANYGIRFRGFRSSADNVWVVNRPIAFAEDDNTFGTPTHNNLINCGSYNCGIGYLFESPTTQAGVAGFSDYGGNYINSQVVGGRIRGGGETKFFGTRFLGSAAHGLEIFGDANAVSFSNYMFGITASSNGLQSQTATITSIANGPGGNILVTLSADHKFYPGFGNIVISGTGNANYDGKDCWVRSVPANNQIVLSVTFDAIAAAGTLTFDDWDLYGVASDNLQNIRSQYFIGGICNYTYLAGGEHWAFIGTRMRLGMYLDDQPFAPASVFLLRTLDDQYGGESTSQTPTSTERVLDYKFAGPGSIGAIGEMGMFRLTGAGGFVPTPGSVAVGGRMPYTAGGLGTDRIPINYNALYVFQNKVELHSNAALWDFTANRLATTGDMILRAGGADGLRLTSTGVRANLNMFPEVTDTVTCGSSTFRWSNVFSVLGSFSGLITASASVLFNASGSGLSYNGGTRAGDATLVAGTVTVANTTVTANTKVLLTRRTPGGTVGNLSYTLAAGASFTINSDNALDTSVVSYMLFERN